MSGSRSGYSEMKEAGQEEVHVPIYSPPIPNPSYQQQHGGVLVDNTPHVSGSYSTRTHNDIPAASGSADNGKTPPGDEDDYEHALIPDRYLNVSSKLVQYTITLHYNLLCIHVQCRFIIVQSIDFKSRLF